MRVLHVFKTYLPDTHGGIEQVIRQMCGATRTLGVSNRILTLSEQPAPEWIEVEGIPVQRVRQDANIASTGLSRAAFGAFARAARDSDVIHYHFPWPFMDVLQLAVRPGKPYVVSYHSDIVKQRHLLQLYRPLQRHFLSRASRIIVATEPYRRSSQELRGLEAHTEVIPYGLDEASYPAPSEACLAQWRQRLGPRFLLFVGVLRYYKGLHLLLDALAGLDLPLAIVGDGPERAALEAQAHRLGLRNCHVLGRLPEEDVAALYSLAETFVFPSHLRSEAFGMALLEAAMYGKPLISCAIGSGMSEINRHEQTGLDVAPTSAAIREALLRLWQAPEERARFGAAARAHFERHFQAEQLGRRLATVYAQIAPYATSPGAADDYGHPR